MSAFLFGLEESMLACCRYRDQNNSVMVDIFNPPLSFVADRTSCLLYVCTHSDCSMTIVSLSGQFPSLILSPPM